MSSMKLLIRLELVLVDSGWRFGVSGSLCVSIADLTLGNGETWVKYDRMNLACSSMVG